MLSAFATRTSPAASPDPPIVRWHAVRRRGRNAGFTLVEMLVAMTVTLILIFAVSQTFAVIGARVAEGRATIEMAGSLRAVANRLQTDLDGLTCPVRPWIDSASGLGYFEIIEGDKHDRSFVDLTQPLTNANQNSILGDVDDLLMFTSRSPNAPFVGRYNGTSITSTVAEIVWWTELQDLNNNGIWDSDERFIIYRRVLLVRPDLNDSTNGYLSLASAYSQNDNDLSVHWETRTVGGNNVQVVVANSLANLTIRANRFAHVSGTGPGGFPHPVNRSTVSTYNTTTVSAFWLLNTGFVQSGARQGEDVMLSEALAFDVKVFDPTAEIHQDASAASTNEALVPGDPGFATGQTLIGRGAFVDLDYANHLSVAVTSTFSAHPQAKSLLNQAAYGGGWIATYDTWAWDYERDGIDQDSSGVVDQGTNGFDDDNANGVDDVGERETSPPYPVPLRGIQVKIRVYEPDTRQIRQATVVADFTPE